MADKSEHAHLAKVSFVGYNQERPNQAPRLITEVEEGGMRWVAGSPTKGVRRFHNDGQAREYDGKPGFVYTPPASSDTAPEAPAKKPAAPKKPKDAPPAE